MTYTASVNIEIGVDDDFRYIVTPNARRVLGDIISEVQNGQHSFTVIGTYGTGKSAFLMALEDGLSERTADLLRSPEVFFGCRDFQLLKAVGDYCPLKDLLSRKLGCSPDNVLPVLKAKCRRAEDSGAATVIFIDEFGKILEHAAKHNPEEELYFIQQLCELVNDHRRKAVLVTTLHQNFSAYAGKLNEAQRNEWKKVKGRFHEVVFSEPVEQLLYLAAEQIEGMPKDKPLSDRFSRIHAMAHRCGFISDGFSLPTAKCLYPMDPLAAQCLTLAIQRYGQNERSLFSFLSSTGRHSLRQTPAGRLYSLSDVYDYLTYNFYSAINEAGLDSSAWAVIKDSIGRVENGLVRDASIGDCLQVVKALGLVGLFGEAGTRLDRAALEGYCSDGLGIRDASMVVDALEAAKVIRFAAYKQKYILFEGTDIDIDGELVKASSVVPQPSLSIEELKDYIAPRVSLASAAYYMTGTPRYFTFVAVNAPEVLVPEGETDGYCELVFPLSDDCEDQVIGMSGSNSEADLYAVFRNADDIRRHLHEIKKLQYIIDNVAVDDKVARREMASMQDFEKAALNSAINDSLFSGCGNVRWYWKGRQVQVRDRRSFNSLLSKVCDEVYHGTPVMNNELFNRQKVTSVICQARVNLVTRLLERGDSPDLGYSVGEFPPEKTIYYSLLKNTGIHYDAGDGIWAFREPADRSFGPLWSACSDFLESSVDRPKKLTELIRTLSRRPFKLKKGFLDIWIPVFLFIRQQDFALYGPDGGYVMGVSREIFDLIQKRPGDYSVKAFNVGGVKLEFFRKYRQFLRADDSVLLKRDTFARTFTPFLQFYRGLDAYARNTRRCSPSTIRFRDVLANAVDPEKAFFEDLPEAFGYRGSLNGNDEFIHDYIDMLRGAIRELNACYPDLIARLEGRVTRELGLPQRFDEYKPVLERRYATVKRHLLTSRARMFLERVLSPAANSREFFEKISAVILDRRLEQMKDREEEYLSDTMLSLFQELDRYQDLSGITGDDSGDTLFSFALTSSTGVSGAQRAYRLPKSQTGRMEAIEEAIGGLLSGDDNLDMCVLLDVIAKRMAK